MNRKKNSISQQEEKNRRRWNAFAISGISVGVVVCIILALLNVFFFHYRQIPHKTFADKSETVEHFEKNYQEAEVILKSYGITAEFETDEDGEYSDEDSYWISKSIILEDESMLTLGFTWDSHSYPDVYVKLEGSHHITREESWLKPEDYPYIYDLATRFVTPKYDAEELLDITISLSDKTKTEIAEGSSEFSRARCDLKTGLLGGGFELGYIDYTSDKDSAKGYKSDFCISSYLY